MNKQYESAMPEQVCLLPSEFKRRFDLNQTLLLKYQSQDLLRPYYFEAGLWKDNSECPNIAHWGWEGPTSEIRGHFLGHWLSAAALSYATHGNAELLGRAQYILGELERCQQENGGEWVGPISEKQVLWTAQGKGFGVPIYNLHKLFMGLNDLYQYAGQAKALQIADRFADWFVRWTEPLSDDQMDQIMEIEAGGILEEWAKLYAATGNAKYRGLMQKFTRRPLLNALLRGEDVLTNMHANTTIPEALGFARVYEVLHDEQYLRAARAYWDLAVNRRGAFVTGAQTSGEVWTPPERMYERMGELTQEHCTLYNMMRLADVLFQYTGEARFAEYRELNLLNGVLAQQHPETGVAAYYLPFTPGAKKKWGTEKHSFWCCCGSVVQAGASHALGIYAENEKCIAVNQYIPSSFSTDRWGRNVAIRQEIDGLGGEYNRLIHFDAGGAAHPGRLAVNMQITCDAPVSLQLRMPEWQRGHDAALNGEAIDVIARDGSFFIALSPGENRLSLRFLMALTAHPLPGSEEWFAFREGPVALAGITERDSLRCDGERPEQLLRRFDERRWNSWRTEYRTANEASSVRFVPLHTITDQPYTVYFQREPK